ncbi:MAG: glycerophosphodiester phosphodiesterase family protein [Desulfosoma sp.]
MATWKDLRESNVFWIGAHRGGLALGPENTLETALLGFRSGAHFWELDVQLSADGVPMVLHDDTLERTTNAPSLYPERRPWYVWNFSRSELAALNIVDFRKNKLHDNAHQTPSKVLRIPTLREALEMTRNLGWLVNVEIKGKAEHHERLVQETLRLITELGMVSQVLLSSFHLEVLSRVRALKVPVATGVLVSDDVKDPVGLVRAWKAFSFHPEQSRVHPEMIEACRNEGIPVIAWTVNDSTRVQKLQNWSVSAVISDRPDELCGKAKRSAHV